MLLTDEYLLLQQLESFGYNKPIYYGDKVPQMFINQNFKLYLLTVKDLYLHA